MDSGYYAACAGLAAQTQALELLAHNLANLSTAGYRGEQTTFRSLLTGRGMVNGNAINVAVNDYGVLSGSRLDLTAGSLVPTGNPLDAAVAGEQLAQVIALTQCYRSPRSHPQMGPLALRSLRPSLPRSTRR